MFCSCKPMSPFPFHVLFSVLLLCFFLNGIGCVLGMSNFTSNVNSLKLERIQRYLGKINKPAVRTVEIPGGGDIIDCVPQHKQPAFSHPLLKNHKIQRAPPVRPAFKSGRTPRNYTVSRLPRGAWQAWHHVGHCPKGTVPIRRSSVDDVLRAQSLYHYGKKKYNNIPLARKVGAPDVVSGNGHEVINQKIETE